MSNQVQITQSSTPSLVELAVPGPQGIPGPDGPPGVGSAWQQGAGAPSSGVGGIGDFYLNTTTGDIYGPKTSNGWGSVVFNIAEGQQGPAGPAGATGPQGPAGAVGAQGPAGPAGATGPAGPAGAAGTQGPAGVVAATAPLTYDAGTQTVAISAATTSAAGSMSAADKTKLDGVAAGATANATDAQLRDRSTHTGTQTASTISDFTSTASAAAPVQSVAGRTGAVTLSSSDVSGLGTFATANAATPPAIGGTTPAAGSFTSLTASTRLGLPSGAPASPAARDLYAVADTLRYRDSGGGERLLLNASDNLANLTSAATARTNLGLGSAATAASGDFLPTTFTAGTISYAATTNLDMAALAGGYRTLSLTGNITFTTSNRASGRTVVIRVICDSTQRTLTFPAGWVFVGTKPANIAGSKTAVLSLTFFGTADTDCVAAYGVQA